MIKAGIIGATGYAGAEVLRLLLQHKEVKITGISSVSFKDSNINEVYPMFNNINEMVLKSADEVIAASEIIFACLPHGLSEEIAAKTIEQGKILIDLGADFRLTDEAVYKEWYAQEFKEKNLHKEAVYGLPELFRENIKGAKIIANPGCYPTSVILAVAPLLKKGLIEIKGIIIDSKSGATGAGRGLNLTTHFTELNEGFAAYKVAQHRHTPEIEQILSIAANEEITVTFTPHLLPVNRGIISTIYADSKDFKSEKDLREIYNEFYKDELFVRIMKKGINANLKNVKYSNYCDISVNTDKRTGKYIIISAIDNMIKGAAGQAIQNMNILCGLPEKTGLDIVPPAF